MDIEETGGVCMEETYHDPKGAYKPIPAKVIHILIKQGWITFPIPPEQEWGLRLLQRIWADRHKTFLRMMLVGIEPEERMLLAKYPRYSKIDRYVLKILLGMEEAASGEREDGVVRPNARRFSTESIKQMVWSYFGQSISDEEVVRLRRVARDYRRGRASDKSKANLLFALSKTT